MNPTCDNKYHLSLNMQVKNDAYQEVKITFLTCEEIIG